MSSITENEEGIRECFLILSKEARPHIKRVSAQYRVLVEKLKSSRVDHHLLNRCLDPRAQDLSRLLEQEIKQLEQDSSRCKQVLSLLCQAVFRWDQSRLQWFNIDPWDDTLGPWRMERYSELVFIRRDDQEELEFQLLRLVYGPLDPRVSHNKPIFIQSTPSERTGVIQVTEKKED